MFPENFAPLQWFSQKLWRFCRGWLEKSYSYFAKSRQNTVWGDLSTQSPWMEVFWFNPIPYEGGGAYGPPWDKLPGNSKLARAEGFWDFYFNLVLHVSAKNWDISMIRWEIIPVLSDGGSEISENPIQNGKKWNHHILTKNNPIDLKFEQK